MYGRSIGKSVVWYLLISLHVLEIIPGKHPLATSTFKKKIAPKNPRRCEGI
jgi:hypothetical protein